MLKVPDKRARNLLDLANLIDRVKADAFDMRQWHTCICGHYMRSHKREDYGNYTKAAELLGITDDMARELFCCDCRPSQAPHMLDNPHQAAERIRRYAFAFVD